MASGSGKTAVQEIVIETCYLCQRLGEPLYLDLSDRLLGTPGRWDLMRCGACGLIWLTPRPDRIDLAELYADYPTHETPAVPATLGARIRAAMKDLIIAGGLGYDARAARALLRPVGAFLSWIPTLRERVLLSILGLEGGPRGKLIDIGCGNGAFLARMRALGWQVQGLEPDSVAAHVARTQYGLTVITAPLERDTLPAQSFDAVTLSHVIEHVEDPIELLTHCRQLLKPGGRLCCLTPNAQSLGHRVFRRSWRGLEPPRHFYLFSRPTLSACLERAGLRVCTVMTSIRRARSFWAASWALRCPRTRWHRYQPVTGVVFELMEIILHIFDSDVGEEVLAIATRD